MELYEHAPIQEAILDIFAQLPAEVSVQKLESFHEKVRDRFPLKRKRVNLQGSFQFGATGDSSVSSNHQIVGFLFLNEATKRGMQPRMDGFTFNKMAPYEEWAKFSAEALELWALFCSEFKPGPVSRIGLRYINRIKIPLPLKDFRDYCLLFPDIPQQLPQQMGEFFMRFTQPLTASREGVAIINLTYSPLTAEAKQLDVFLDIDVLFPRLNIEPGSHEVVERLNILRAEKNLIFESSVTPNAKALFH